MGFLKSGYHFGRFTGYERLCEWETFFSEHGKVYYYFNGYDEKKQEIGADIECKNKNSGKSRKKWYCLP